MKLSVQLKIIAAFLVVAAVSSGSVALMSIQQATARLRENAVEHFGEMAEELSYSVEETLADGCRYAVLLSRNAVVASDAPPEAKEKELKSKKDIFKAYEDFTIIDSGGVVTASTGGGAPGDWPHREVFEEALAGRPAMSDVYVDEDSGKTLVTFAAPVFGADGGVGSVLAVQMNMEEVWDNVGYLKLGETGFAYVVDGHDRYVAHPDEGLILSRPDPSIIGEIEEGRESVSYRDERGVDFVGNFFPKDREEAEAQAEMLGVSAPSGWRVVVAQESEEVFRLVKSFRRRALAFAFIVFLLAVLLGVWLSRTITNPIRRLTVGAEALGEGDYDHRVEVGAQDEIGRLAKTFNLMAEALSGDIAERQRTAQALSESEELYRHLVETSPDAIMLIDLDTEVIVANRRAVSTFGFASREEMVGENVFDYIAPEVKERALRIYAEGVAGAPVKNVELLLTRRDGRIFPAEISASMVYEASGRPRGFILIIRDVTERKASEEALRESEEKYRAVFEATGTAMCIVEADGLISFANQEFLGIAGLAAFEPGGRTGLSKLLLEEDRETFTRNLRHAERGPAQVPLRFPLRLHKSSGEVVHTLASMVRVPGTDTMVLSLIDVTREWRYERTLEEQTQQLRDFLSIASHELRHPITLIKGYVELLTEELEGEAVSGPAQLSLQRIQTSTDRLTLLGEELMDASRIEQDSFILMKTRLNLLELVRQAVREIEERGVECSFSVRLANPCGEIEADRDKVYRLLIILIENAAKFSPRDALVEVEVAEQPTGQTVSVLDRGVGIPEGERAKVFDRFYQVEDVLHHSNGLGLGLYIATEIVESHGGRIWTASREGGGSIFSFFLPF